MLLLYSSSNSLVYLENNSESIGAKSSDFKYISIKSDGDFADYGFEGDGSRDNPWLIAGGPTVVHVIGTSVYFTIENQNLNGNYESIDCIYFKNVQNALIQNNDITAGLHGIFIDEDCSNIKIYGNEIDDCIESGIRVNASTNIDIKGNTVYDFGPTLRGYDGNGIWLRNSPYCNVTDNTVYECGSAIWLFTNSNHGRIVGNEVLDSNNGIMINASTDCEIIDNEVYSSDAGIILFNNADNTVIQENTVWNTIAGIWVNVSSTCNITGNTVYDSDVGIEFLDSADNNIIEKNTVSNTTHGIRVSFSSFCNITDNTVYDADLGIVMLEDGDYSQIVSNTVWDASYSIMINASTGNTVQGNSLFDETNLNNSICGIFLKSGASENYIMNNTVINCDSFAFRIDNTSTGNEIRWNSFIRNNLGAGSQAESEEDDNLITHNFWNEHTEPDVAEPYGIVDVKYDLNSTLATPPSDLNPLTEPPTDVDYHYISQVKVIYPNGGEVFTEELTIQWNELFDTLDHPINYSVYYSDDGGENWVELAVDLTETSYEWNVTEVPKGSNYLIMVIANCSAGLSNNDTSDAPFTIQADLVSKPTVIYPNHMVELYGLIEIIWAESVDTWGHNVSYDVFYSNNSGVDWYILASGLNVTSLEWNTTTVPDGNEYLIMVKAICSEGVSSNDTSNSVFTISQHLLTAPVLLYPNGGELINESLSINWTESSDSKGFNVTYDLYYSPDSGQNWMILVSDLENTSYIWNTTYATKGSEYVMKVVAKSEVELSAEDISDAAFTLQPDTLSLPTLVFPVGGEVVNGTITINWTKSVSSWGNPVTYSVFYSTDEVNWVLLISGITDTYLEWSTTTVVDGPNYIIKVIASSKNVIAQQSSSTFSIYNEVTPTTPTTPTTTTPTTTTPTTTTTTTTVPTTTPTTNATTTGTTTPSPSPLGTEVVIIIVIGGVVVMIIIIFIKRKK